MAIGYIQYEYSIYILMGIFPGESVHLNISNLLHTSIATRVANCKKVFLYQILSNYLNECICSYANAYLY